jgi:hypothetical protein
MTKEEVRKAARQSILDGKTKQETFEELKGTSYRSWKSTVDLAKIIQKIPTLQVRKKYKTLNVILVVILSLTVLF